MSESWHGIPEDVLAQIHELERKREILPFAGEDIARIFHDPKFVRALTFSSEVTSETGHESGFNVFFDKEKQLYIAGVFEGGTDSLIYRDENTELVADFDRPAMDQIKSELWCSTVLDLHFHPDTDGSIEPSMGDLHRFASDRQHSIHDIPAMAIAVIRQNQDVDVLLIHSRGYDVSYMKQLEVEISSLEQEDVQQFLNEAGFFSCMIQFRKENKELMLVSNVQSLLQRFKPLTLGLARFDEVDHYYS